MKKKTLEDYDFRVYQVNGLFYPQYNKRNKKENWNGWKYFYFWVPPCFILRDYYKNLGYACEQIKRFKRKIEPIIKIHACEGKS